MEEKKDWTREELEKEYVNKMKAVTIPVNVSFSGKQRILDMNELEELLKSADIIAQGVCDCRSRMGHCIEPMDGCLGIGDEAREWIEEGNARRISVEEALAAMERTFDAGFVHMAYIFNDSNTIQWICSCCRCCCHSLSAALRFGYSDHVIFSNKISVQDSELCNDCGACEDRCQFQARVMEDDTLKFEPEKCAGCGLCLSECPTEAISMKDREEVAL